MSPTINRVRSACSRPCSILTVPRSKRSTLAITRWMRRRRAWSCRPMTPPRRQCIPYYADRRDRLREARLPGPYKPIAAHRSRWQHPTPDPAQWQNIQDYLFFRSNLPISSDDSPPYAMLLNNKWLVSPPAQPGCDRQIHIHGLLYLCGLTPITGAGTTLFLMSDSQHLITTTVA